MEREGKPKSALGWGVAPARAMGASFQEFSPLGFQPLGLFTRPWEEAARRVVPSAAADVASALDPAYGRETGRTRITELHERYGEGEGVADLAPWKYRLPGFRQDLPETFQPVDVFGRPRFDRPIAGPGTTGTGEVSNVWRGIMRTVAPSLGAAEPPAMNLQDPQMKALHDLGIRMQPPSGRTTIPGLGLPMTSTSQSTASVQRLRGMSREMAAKVILQIPGLQAIPDSPRKRFLVKQLMETIQSSFSRAFNPSAFPLSIAQGARPPAFLARARVGEGE